jgi:hypothetical protein
MAKGTKVTSTTFREDRGTQGEDSAGSSVVTTLIAGAAVAVLAPELLVGMAVGVAAVTAPRILPIIGNVMDPIFRTAVKAGYGAAVKAREMAAEAGEQIQDIVAEAKAEAETAEHDTAA